MHIRIVIDVDAEDRRRTCWHNLSLAGLARRPVADCLDFLEEVLAIWEQVGISLRAVGHVEVVIPIEGVCNEASHVAEVLEEAGKLIPSACVAIGLWEPLPAAAILAEDDGSRKVFLADPLVDICVLHLPCLVRTPSLDVQTEYVDRDMFAIAEEVIGFGLGTLIPAGVRAGVHQWDHAHLLQSRGVRGRIAHLHVNLQVTSVSLEHRDELQHLHLKLVADNDCQSIGVVEVLDNLLPPTKDAARAVATVGGLRRARARRARKPSPYCASAGRENVDAQLVSHPHEGLEAFTLNGTSRRHVDPHHVYLR
mmetsp:Transcript_66737/g.168412  ORF Transcript_66737/g.168412 Transcript_66737/m.168412 type:complete len:309 (+) Transcript_66737:203-1129(+)